MKTYAKIFSLMQLHCDDSNHTWHKKTFTKTMLKKNTDLEKTAYNAMNSVGCPKASKGPQREQHKREQSCPTEDRTKKR